MNNPQRKFQEAHEALKKYYRNLVGQLADEIIQNRESFETAEFDGKADDILEKYSKKLYSVGAVHCNLAQFTGRMKPTGLDPLGKDQFRCFDCGSVINRDDEVCRVCGWSWRWT